LTLSERYIRHTN